MCWSRYTEIPPSTRTRFTSATTSRLVPSGSVMPRPSGSTATSRAERRRVEQAAGPLRVGALDLELEGGPGQQLRDRPLPDDLAAVDDGHGVAGALHLVEQVRGQHDRAALRHEGEDHVAHLEHAARVEAVHRLVEDQQLRVAEEAGRDAEPLAHAHGVLRHLVVGSVQDADALERRVDAALRRRLTRRGEDLEVLAAGEMAVEAWLVDDGADPRQRAVTVTGDRSSRGATWCPSRHGSGPGAPGSASSCRRRWARDSRRRSPAGPGARRRRRRRCPRSASSARGSRRPTRRSDGGRGPRRVRCR